MHISKLKISNQRILILVDKIPQLLCYLYVSRTHLQTSLTMILLKDILWSVMIKLMN